MHARNPYRVAPDFEALALFYPPLLAHVRRRTIDFNDDAAQRCLTQALLKRDFGLELHLPTDRLCPPVLQTRKGHPRLSNIERRVNYVLWIQDIVADLQRAVPYVFGGLGNVQCTVRGLDVGTGASAIFPLLTCSLEPTWKFIATELDDQSYEHARANVRTNNLLHQIDVVKVKAEGPQDPTLSARELHFNFEGLFGVEEEDKAGDGVTDKSVDMPMTRCLEIRFTMCNPPFYSSAADIVNSEAMKESSAFGVCTGAPIEMVTPGGESHFVKAMVHETLSDWRNMHRGNLVKRRRTEDEEILLGERRPGPSTTGTISHQKGLCWYTSMLGKMASVVEVVETFKELGISNYAITEFVQGQTRRWAVGWCVGGWRLRDDITRIANPNATLQRLLPARNSLYFDIYINKFEAHERLNNVLRCIEGADVMPVKNPGDNTDTKTRNQNAGADKLPSPWNFVVAVAGDTWSRSARRKHKRKREEYSGAENRAFSESSSKSTSPALVCAFVFRVVDEAEAEIQTRTRTRMKVQWIYGHDRSLLESFASHVARRIENSTAPAG